MSEYVPIVSRGESEAFNRWLNGVIADALEEAAEGVEIDMGRGFTGSDDHVATAHAEAWLRARAQQIRETTNHQDGSRDDGR